MLDAPNLIGHFVAQGPRINEALGYIERAMSRRRLIGSSSRCRANSFGRATVYTYVIFGACLDLEHRVAALTDGDGEDVILDLIESVLNEAGIPTALAADSLEVVGRLLGGDRWGGLQQLLSRGFDDIGHGMIGEGHTMAIVALSGLIGKAAEGIHSAIEDDLARAAAQGHPVTSGAPRHRELSPRPAPRGAPDRDRPTKRSVLTLVSPGIVGEIRTCQLDDGLIDSKLRALDLRRVVSASSFLAIHSATGGIADSYGVDAGYLSVIAGLGYAAARLAAGQDVLTPPVPPLSTDAESEPGLLDAIETLGHAQLALLDATSWSRVINDLGDCSVARWTGLAVNQWREIARDEGSAGEIEPAAYIAISLGVALALVELRES